MKGEDTFGDSESEEEDVIVTASNGCAGGSSPSAPPRRGLGAGLASIVHGAGGAQTCNLDDHPIQVREGKGRCTVGG